MAVMAMERRDGVNQLKLPNNPTGEDLAAKTKSFAISKREVWEAWKVVRSNKGGPGIDDQTIEAFEQDITGNLYKLWNRMASGSYMPKGVKRVDIPKPDGGTRPLGIPSVFDRIAQTVVKRRLEPELERVFCDSSYGFRPNRSAKQAVMAARENCWRYAWVVDVDIKSFFDEIDHDLLMKAVHHHVSESWMLLYIERWLKAPVVLPDGSLEQRSCGTPQGGVVSPLLANLFLHYAFDHWMAARHRSIVFERYADDIICHCRTEYGARELLGDLVTRFGECGLTLHPSKTKVVYCKDDKRPGRSKHMSFDFLGFTFRPRMAYAPKSGNYFVGFNPGVSNKALKRMGLVIRRWNIHLKSSKTLVDLGRMFNPVLRGWINYFGWVNKAALRELLKRLDLRLARWVMKKHKKYRGHKRRARAWLRQYLIHNRSVFAHWRFVYPQATG
jgi:group II intron reverse transcriptase/maturase